MFRNESGKVKWSWNRLVTNAVPNFVNNSKGDAELTPKQQDDLFRFQLLQPDPKVLHAQSFYITGIVENQSQSPRILSALQKLNILLPKPPYVQTSLIDKHFPHKLAIIPMHRQHKLVCMLFFWEEELMRWRLLDDEEAEIRDVMQANKEAGESEMEELKVALGTVFAKREMTPAMRVLEGKGALPGYGEGGTLGLVGGKAGGRN